VTAHSFLCHSKNVILSQKRMNRQFITRNSTGQQAKESSVRSIFNAELIAAISIATAGF
jgi:hypothetical protein